MAWIHHQSHFPARDKRFCSVLIMWPASCQVEVLWPSCHQCQSHKRKKLSKHDQSGQDGHSWQGNRIKRKRDKDREGRRERRGRREKAANNISFILWRVNPSLQLISNGILSQFNNGSSVTQVVVAVLADCAVQVTMETKKALCVRKLSLLWTIPVSHSNCNGCVESRITFCATVSQGGFLTCELRRCWW